MMTNKSITLQEFFDTMTPPAYKSDFICRVKNEVGLYNGGLYDLQYLTGILNNLMLESTPKGAF